MSNTNTFNFKEPTRIPGWIKEKLHMKMRLYGKELWFAKAWMDYIKICRVSNVRDIPDPDAFFEEKQMQYGVRFSDDSDENALYSAEPLLDATDFDAEEDDEVDEYEEALESDLDEI